MSQNYVVGFAFTEDRSQVVLIRKNRPEWQVGKLNGVGGAISPNEDGISCIVREFQEETGVITHDQEWECFAVSPTLKSDSKIFYYKLFNDNILTADTRTDEEVVIAAVEFDRFDTEGLSDLSDLIRLALDPTLEEISSKKRNKAYIH